MGYPPPLLFPSPVTSIGLVYSLPAPPIPGTVGFMYPPTPPNESGQMYRVSGNSYFSDLSESQNALNSSNDGGTPPPPRPGMEILLVSMYGVPPPPLPLTSNQYRIGLLPPCPPPPIPGTVGFMYPPTPPNESGQMYRVSGTLPPPLRG